jgi:hypothetical protein
MIINKVTITYVHVLTLSIGSVSKEVMTTFVISIYL